MPTPDPISKQVAIVGAGFAGLVTAKTLIDFGYSVVVYEAAPDVGGVWSRTRRYPGVKTQNSKDTYALSTLPMPKAYPKHPSGTQVQAYLEAYVEQHQLDEGGRLRLRTEVVEATQVKEGWLVESRDAQGVTSNETFHALVVATGAFCKGAVPSFLGTDDFVKAGGRVCHTSDLRAPDELKDKNVVVVGYGKSACDAAVQAQAVAKHTSIVARNIIWKLPTMIGGALHYSYLLLTRVGESLFEYFKPWTAQKFLNSPYAWPIRTMMLSTLSAITSAQLQLDRANLKPKTDFETIARANISLASDGLSEAVLAGRISIHRETTIESLSPGAAHLTNGETIPADVVLCGTGWSQAVPPFLPLHLTPKLVNALGNWTLYRHILPVGVPNLFFNGFNSSLFCPLTAEVTALWIAVYLESTQEVPLLPIPDETAQREAAELKLAWMEERTNGKHAKGTNLVPFSLSNIDEMLDDLGIGIGPLSYLREWLLPVDPSAYSCLGDKLRTRKQRLEREEAKRK